MIIYPDIGIGLLHDHFWICGGDRDVGSSIFYIFFYRQDHIKQMEEVKSKQDLLIDSMNEDIKRLTDRKAEMI